MQRQTFWAQLQLQNPTNGLTSDNHIRRAHLVSLAEANFPPTNQACQGPSSPAAKSAKIVSACFEAQWAAPSSPQPSRSVFLLSHLTFNHPLPLPPHHHHHHHHHHRLAKCYDRYGNEDITRYPCSQDEDPAQCCGVGELCASNGLCVRLEDDSDPTYWQNTCSVSDWIDGDVDSCPTQCAEIRSTTPIMTVF
jgi:hypothetical protein